LQEGHVWNELNLHFTPLPLDESTTSLNSTGGGGNEGPMSKLGALRYLNAHRCPDKDVYYKYADVLSNPKALLMFWSKDTYIEKIEFLEWLYNDQNVRSKGLFGKHSWITLNYTFS